MGERARWCHLAIDGSGDLTLPESQRLDYLKQAFVAPGHDPSSWLTGWYPETHDAQAQARNETPVDAYFAGGSVPILDLQAQYGTVVVPNVFKPILGDRVTTAVVPDAGHAIAPEQPEAMSDAIAQFARSVYQIEPWSRFETGERVARTRDLSRVRPRSAQPVKSGGHSPGGAIPAVGDELVAAITRKSPVRHR
ncbi:alpha/beta fold hydrolase [Rhodococcus jostii]|uniref:alpha/beta fold hydrolase n=1 Tax=Rhodococcus jostii TaxID=132919 RepID=UPI0036376FB8